MLEVKYDDAVFDEAVLAFDGRVLELFQWRTSQTQRVHVAMLHVEAHEPDRRGNRSVWVTARPNRKGGGMNLSVRPEDWAAVQPVLEAAVLAATS